eukprot:CAMPEP_0198116290 /NCGR_PEP_ID=MMETSP1442-20131203/11096_1 /TAXON_ID= /ORGANISM="Craspedostauros australis, Strain CCMP3328" /LENGTH=54 /DNA_ID=CAMNT_0043774073 /DNA_START=35 /DNA_END=196 /DNA_ORIENTATION=-
MAALVPQDRTSMVLYVRSPCSRDSGGGTVSICLLIAEGANPSQYAMGCWLDVED